MDDYKLVEKKETIYEPLYKKQYTKNNVCLLIILNNCK